jgi:flagellin-like hook-associated protein FlgL
MGITLSAGVRQNLLSLQNTADLAATTQNRLATGKKVNSALDNPANFFTSQGLQNRASDLNDLLDSIGQAQKTLDAANQGLTSLTKLVQSAKSLAQQARQVAEPQTTYAVAGATGVVGVNLTETVGQTTATLDHPGTWAGGTLSFDVITGGTTTTVTTTALAANADGATTAAAISAAIAGNTATAGRVVVDFGTTTANRITLKAADSDTDFTVKASALTLALGLTTGAATDNAVTSTNLIDAAGSSGALAGKVLTVAANGGTSRSVTFGNGAGQVSRLSELQTALAGSGVSASLTPNGAANNLTLSVAATTGTQNSLAISGTAAGTVAGTIGIAAATVNGTASSPTPDATRSNLQTQYNNLLSQIDSLAKDASYNGVNLLNGDNLKVVFNEKGTSTLTITGVKYDSAGLGQSALSGTEFQTNAAIDTVISNIDSALTKLRTQASNFGSSLTTVQTRQDFTKNLINTLQTGADALVLADTNEEGANLLALQTRQQLSTTALSLANQASQAVLRLF